MPTSAVGLLKIATREKLMDEKLTVSSKVNCRDPVSMSIEKRSNWGLVVSAVKLFTAIESPFGTGTTLFPFMSSMARSERVMNVVTLEIARSIRRLISFMSSIPMLTTISGQSLLVENVDVFPPVKENLSTSRDMFDGCRYIAETFRVETSTVSEKVKNSSKESISRSNDTNSGETLSSVNRRTGVGLLELICSTKFPFMSAIVKLSMARKVSL